LLLLGRLVPSAKSPRQAHLTYCRPSARSRLASFCSSDRSVSTKRSSSSHIRDCVCLARAQRLIDSSYWSPPRGGFTYHCTFNQTNRPFGLGSTGHNEFRHSVNTARRSRPQQPEPTRPQRYQQLYRAPTAEPTTQFLSLIAVLPIISIILR